MENKEQLGSDEDKDAYIANCIESANDMFYKVRQMCQNREWMEKEDPDKISDFRGFGYDEFITKFVIVSRAMITHGEYHPNAFDKYLRRLLSKGYASKEEWVERQADYMKYLWLDLKSKGSSKRYKKLADSPAADKYWRDTKAGLQGEYDSFHHDFETAQMAVKEKQEKITDELKADLLKLADQDPARMEQILAMMGGD